MEGGEISSEPSLEEVVQSCHLGKSDQRRATGSESLDFSSKYAGNISDVYSSGVKQTPRLSSSYSHRNGFSKSMGDLSRISSGYRKSVVFDEDLFAHKEMLQRARNRFKELELKYPEIFKNSSRTSSLASSSATSKSGIRSFDRSESLELQQSMERQDIQTTSLDTLQVPRSGIHDHIKSDVATTSRRRPPPLSVAMKLHNLESSCDSAFDEIDHESIECSRTSHEPTPTSQYSNHFLYPGDSLESDKDSGISTDRPFTPSSRPSRPVRWADPAHSDSKSFATKSKSLSALSSRTNSQELSGSEGDNNIRQRIDRRGILKSVAYRNQEIKAESLDMPCSTTANTTANSVDYCRGRQNLGVSLSGNLRRGTSIYRRSLFSASNSQDDTDSDAETVCSVQSELIMRPHMSARERYFSTYQLNTISEGSHNGIHHKWRSMPELGRGSFGSAGAPSFCGDTLPAGFEEKKKKKRKFGRRSGLYIVNDIPASEKPRLSGDKGKSRSKIFNKKSKKLGSVHVNELTKTWFDHRTAVSQPTGGKSLGKIIAVREDLGSAYVLELQRSPGGLFGFFIQKGFKQFKSGVFVSRIMDCSSSKFMAGLLNPGDEILEINGENTASKSMSEVHNILANSDKLLLTVLPFLGRKDW